MEEEPRPRGAGKEVDAEIKEEEEELKLPRAMNTDRPGPRRTSTRRMTKDLHPPDTGSSKRNFEPKVVVMEIKGEESEPEAEPAPKKPKTRKPGEPRTLPDPAPSETAAFKRRGHNQFIGRDWRMADLTDAVPDPEQEHLSPRDSHDYYDNDDDVDENASTSSNDLGTPDTLPMCWTEDQANYFKTQNPWLRIRNGKLGCDFCIQVGRIGLQTQIRGARFAREWTDFLICSAAETRKAQQTALRKKIWEHRESHCHQQAVNFLRQAQECRVEEAALKRPTEQEEMTCRVFRTAYMIGKANRPFSDMPGVVELQVENGLKMGSGLQTPQSCADICEFIGDEMKRCIVRFVIEQDVKFGVLVDECGDAFSDQPVLSVYVRAPFGEESEPTTVFLQLLELQRTSAEDVTEALLGCLHEHFPEDFLAKNWIALTADAASAVTGRASGVPALLTHPDRYPNLVVWHCCSHRLERAVGDALKEAMGTHSFEDFVADLYCLCACSYRKRAGLHACAEDLAVAFEARGGVLDTAWLASSSRTVTAVWNSYPALSAHFKSAASDPTLDLEEKAEYSSLLERLTSVEFVKNLGLLRDALQEMADLSSMLQAASTTLPDAHILICRQVKVFQALAGETELEFTKMAANSAARLEFQGVPLHAGREVVVEIDGKQLYRNLAISLQKRLLTTSSSLVPTDQGGTILSDFEELTAACKVVYPQYWPTDYDILYGESELVALCKRFQLPARPIVQAFREYKDNAGRNVPDEMLPLVVALKTVATSTAECGAVLRAMNAIVTPFRDPLSVPSLSHLLCLQHNGPPLGELRPEKYVKTWLLQGRPGADHAVCSKLEEKEEEEDPKRFVWCLL